ncbi:carboxymuconolactone decarboxylase family protein [Lysobacter humi (ex Lee et al. 2017)]
MPAIRPIDPQQADTATAQTLAGVRAKFGLVPNMMATMAHAPAVLDGYLKLAGALSGGRLSAKRREAIALAVAQANRCGYCLAAHTALGGLAGLSADEQAAARDGAARDPADAALLRLARGIVETKGHPAEADVAAFRAQGFGDAELLEVVANVALNIYTNYVNHIADPEIDFTPVPLDRAA